MSFTFTLFVNLIPARHKWNADHGFHPQSYSGNSTGASSILLEIVLFLSFLQTGSGLIGDFKKKIHFYFTDKLRGNLHTTNPCP